MSDARLFLITPPVADAARFKPLLEAAMGATEIACVLLRTAGRDEGETKAIVRALAATVQDAGAALLVAGDRRLAARIDADGVHMEEGGAALAEAIASLQPKKIVGAGGLPDRDAAMVTAEAGVDYLLFGGPDRAETAAQVLDRVEWWAEIFNVPCVGYAHGLGDIAALAAAGADFVAICEGVWDEPATTAATLRAASDALRAPEVVR